VARVLEWFRNVKDEARVISWIRKSLDRISQPEAKALDRLFEMEIAGRLARRQALSISTGEPDVIADLPESEFPGGRRLRFACKHPDSESAVGANVRKAGEQIVGQGDQGVILVSLDSVVHQPNRWLSVAAPEVHSVASPLRGSSRQWKSDTLEEVDRADDGRPEEGEEQCDASSLSGHAPRPAVESEDFEQRGQRPAAGADPQALVKFRHLRPIFAELIADIVFAARAVACGVSSSRGWEDLRELRLTRGGDRVHHGGSQGVGFV
jgi:hypothetical protein